MKTEIMEKLRKVYGKGLIDDFSFRMILFDLKRNDKHKIDKIKVRVDDLYEEVLKCENRKYY